MSTDHDDVRMLIGAYVLGGLGETDRRVLESHLPMCRECRDELASSAPLAGLLRRAPAMPAPRPRTHARPAPTRRRRLRRPGSAACWSRSAPPMPYAGAGPVGSGWHWPRP